MAVDVFDPPGSSILVALEGAGAGLSTAPRDGSWESPRTFDFTNESPSDLVKGLVGGYARYARPADMGEVEAFVESLGTDFALEAMGGDMALGGVTFAGCEDSTKALKEELKGLVGLVKEEAERSTCNAYGTKVVRVSSLGMLEREGGEFAAAAALFEKAVLKLMEVAAGSPCGAVFQVVRAESFVNEARRLEVRDGERQRKRRSKVMSS